MTLAGLLYRGVVHHLRTHLGVLLGVAISAAVLVGGLAVGDSVRASLRQRALLRVGDVGAALVGGDRLFPADLAARLQTELPGARVSPVLWQGGSVSRDPRRSEDVQVLGVEASFFSLSPSGAALAAPPPGSVFVNESLAKDLQAAPGDAVVLRVATPRATPRDLALSGSDEATAGFRATVERVLPDDQFGGFALQLGSRGVRNAVVSLSWLAERLEVAGQANLVLVSASDADVAARADGALGSVFQPADLQLQLRAEGSGTELRTARVFLDAVLEQKAIERGQPALGVLTYFVNRLHDPRTARETPYSTVTALGELVAASSYPAWIRSVLELGTGEILLTDWLAEDLAAEDGDALEMDFFVLGSGGKLEEQSSTLGVRGSVPLGAPGLDASWMADFPGLQETESCRDWDPGIPLDRGRLRPEDERYWEEHRGTPKAFLALRRAQELWSSPFGSLTAIRFPDQSAAEIERWLESEIRPADLGLAFRDVRAEALQSATPTTDFAGLFLGLSFFLILAAVLLTVLLFVLGVERRSAEIGILRGVGFGARDVQRLFLGEALLLAIVGAALGVPLGLLYTRFLLGGLGGDWQDAVAGAQLVWAVTPTSVLIGALGSIAVSMGAVWLVLRRRTRAKVVSLLAGLHESERPRRRWLGKRLCQGALLAGLVGSVACMVATSPWEGNASGLYFGAGALLLLPLLALVWLWLHAMETHGTGSRLTLRGLGIRSTARAPQRSFSTAALWMLASFLVASVGANRLPTAARDLASDPGTGGFRWIAETAVGVPEDLDSTTGREALALDTAVLSGVRVLSLRANDGDEASCRNLSRTIRPRIAAAPWEALRGETAFAFAGTLGGKEDPWELLSCEAGAVEVPVIGDLASVTWSLHRKVGETLAYVDERGQEFVLRIVATLRPSVLQGYLLMDEAPFRARFPSASGGRLLLIDAPPEGGDAPRVELERGLRDFGFRGQSTAERMAELRAVQNTYLAIFEWLGGLGLLLGAVGLGVVVLRNVLDRRAELAALRAMGYRRREVVRLVVVEHGSLLLCGLAGGALAALVAMIPTLIRESGASPVPWLWIGVVALSSLLWILVATWAGTRGELIPALRDD